MKKIIIGSIEKDRIIDHIEIDDPNMSFIIEENSKYWINYQKFGKKNTELFLNNILNVNFDLIIFSQRKPPKTIIDKIGNKNVEKTSKNNQVNWNIINKISIMHAPFSKKLKLFQEVGLSPRLILDFLVKNSKNQKLINNLVKIDLSGEPTFEALAIACTNE